MSVQNSELQLLGNVLLFKSLVQINDFPIRHRDDCKLIDMEENHWYYSSNHFSSAYCFQLRADGAGEILSQCSLIRYWYSCKIKSGLIWCCGTSTLYISEKEKTTWRVEKIKTVWGSDRARYILQKFLTSFSHLHSIFLSLSEIKHLTNGRNSKESQYLLYTWSREMQQVQSMQCKILRANRLFVGFQGPVENAII